MDRRDFGKRSPGKLVSMVRGSLAFVPGRLPPDNFSVDERIQAVNDEALLSLGELRAIIPRLPNPNLVSQPFLRREAVLSSRIEGTKTEMEGLLLYETERPKSDDSPEQQDAREVANYVTALNHGLKSLEDLPVCNRLLKEMHAILLSGGRGQDSKPGEFRDMQVFIGGDTIENARYVAPPHTRTDRLMDRLEKYINGPSSYPLLVKVAMVHYQFEAIHPFMDGNGRLGRLLITLLLCASGALPQPLLYLSAFFERNREEYYDLLLTVSTKGMWFEWVSFFLRGVASEAKDAAVKADSILSMRETIRQHCQSKDGANASILTLVDTLFEWPVISVNAAAKILNMSYQGARKNVERLVEMEFLVEATGKRRGKVYIAKPVIELVS